MGAFDPATGKDSQAGAVNNEMVACGLLNKIDTGQPAAGDVGPHINSR